jgi:hypothetical protein
MRCLQNLGYWNKLEGLTEVAYELAAGRPEQQAKVALYALKSSFNLGKFDVSLLFDATQFYFPVSGNFRRFFFLPALFLN